MVAATVAAVIFFFRVELPHVVSVCTFESRTQRQAGDLATISWRVPRDKSRLKNTNSERRPELVSVLQTV